MKKSLLLCVLQILVTYCFSQSGTYCIENRFSEKALFDSAQITVTKDIMYSVPKKWPGTGVDTLKLDMYYPSAAAETLAKRPCIVFFYGGAWILGNKNDAGIKQKCLEWARRGFVVAAPNYRLGWNCAASDLLSICVLCQGNYYDLNTAVYRGAQDGKAAMRYIVANQNTYKIDTSALFIGGESAGSFNANHTAHWDHDYGKKVFNGNPYKILGSLDSAGGNIGTPFRIKAVINSCGAVVNDTVLKLKIIPTVLFHDVLDCVVPFRVNQTLNCCATSFFYAKGSANLYSQLTKAGVPAELHYIQAFTPAHCSYPAIRLVEESSCFLKKVLCGIASSDSIKYPTNPPVNCNALKTNAFVSYSNELIRMAPVPADGLLTIAATSNITIENLVVYNAVGSAQLVPFYWISNTGYLHTNGLPNGVYSIRFQLSSGAFGTRKILILHP